MSDALRGASPAAAVKKQILFVDDDQFLLEGLRGALRPYRRQWEMRFVESSADAITAIDAQPPDVIVADLRMPGTDGARLLEMARDLCPGAIRLVLSGYAEITLVARAAAVAHRLIAKPCDATDLAQVIESSCALQDLAGRIEVAHQAIGKSSLPALPRIYADLGEVIGSGTAGAADAAAVVQQDAAISAKVLQLANSAYFGRRYPVTSLSTAVAYIGVDVLRALVLQTETFRTFRVEPPIAGFDPEALQEHSGRVARVASALDGRGDSHDDAFAAGLLHDLGLLVLASESPAELEQILTSARERGVPLADVEMELLGATHGEIGAYLLGLWGLPPAVTEAIARHQTARGQDLPWGSVTALYVANALVEELEAGRSEDAPTPTPLDLEYLAQAGVADRLDEWRSIAAEQVGGPA